MPAAPKDSARLRRLTGQLLRCGWLESIRELESGSFELGWTRLGEQRSLLVGQVISSFGLAGPEVSLVQFTREGQKAKRAHRGDSREATVQFWVACLEELHLIHDEDEQDLRSFVTLLSRGVEGQLPHSVSIVEGTIRGDFR